ncbi:TetR/AcrR family transcriptional regulator [Frankia sp. AiPa1]|uniref:TetR/AcrR family transcriptional regulator n=1 Tax=Frankia sp. AiPa1 TaxID=573492 RepID=UPI00202B7376|nr:TetR/AcrR family transcriptional regulator [Frankia sp. AiPa1]MCL9760477.1 TetR/AcrR family transcriptional regulator [Frankia sp. AiPa1]
MSRPVDGASRGAPRGLPAKRQAIIEAALRLFARQGFASTTLEDIAREAPTSRQTVYSHFGDKESLFQAVIDTHLSATLDRLHAAATDFPRPAGPGLAGGHGEPEPDPVAHLDTLAQRLAAIARDPRSVLLRQLLQAEGSRRPELFELWRTRVARPVFAEVAAHLGMLIGAGVLRIDDPLRAAGQFIALVWGTAWQMSALGDVAGAVGSAAGAAELDAARESAVRLFVRGYS